MGCRQERWGWFENADISEKVANAGIHRSPNLTTSFATYNLYFLNGISHERN
jgi:hypothetical protein